jgi:hypothetical protein
MRTGIGKKALSSRLSWANAGAAGFLAHGGEVAACFFRVVGKVPPVDTAE